MSLVSVMRSCHRLIVIVSAALFVQLSGQARADSPLTVRSGDISTVWQEVWGHAYSPNASTMLVSPATAGGLQIHASQFPPVIFSYIQEVIFYGETVDAVERGG